MEPNQTFRNSQGWRENKRHPLQPSWDAVSKNTSPGAAAARGAVSWARLSPGPASLCSAASNPSCDGQGRGSRFAGANGLLGEERGRHRLPWRRWAGKSTAGAWMVSAQPAGSGEPRSFLSY